MSKSSWLTYFGLFVSSLVCLPLFAQQAEKPVIEEHMRYSREKDFNSWSVNFGYGPLITHTDVTRYIIFPDERWLFGPTVYVSKQVKPAFAFDLQFLMGDMHGEKNGYYFEGDLLDYTLNHVGYINQLVRPSGPIKDKWNFYYKVGFGFKSFRSKLYHAENNKVVQRNDFTGNGDMRYVVHGYDVNDHTKEIRRENELVLPMGLGALYRLNRSFDVGIESTLRFSLKDNLDNVLAGATNDSYWYTGFQISYKLGKKDKRHLRWTHRGYGFNVFGHKKYDPLEEEIKRFEKNMKEVADARPVKTDSVIIVHTLKKIYGKATFYSLFFESGSTRVNPDDLYFLADVAMKLMKNPEWKVEVLGYSDETGAADKNMEVSRQRCDAVRDILVRDFEIPLEQIELVPKGETELLSPTDILSPRGIHLVNRRVDVVIRR